MIENITGVARTAWYCLGVRWADAQKKAPVCGDPFAELFMDEEARRLFEPFAALRLPNAAGATRARIFDDWLRDRLLADPEQLVILVGAGFDARAFRLPGGRWVEFDQPGLIAEKERLLPARRAPQPLTRIAIDFAIESLADRLEPFAGEAPVIVLEGVSMYLTEAQLRSTLAALSWAFPRHTLFIDLMTKRFADRHGGAVRQRLAAIGGHFASDMTDDPARRVSRQGYRPLARTSILSRASELRALPIPKFLFDTLLRPLRDGYCAYVFEAGAR
jgi:methyltransferase (TIGR00027 family)